MSLGKEGVAVHNSKAGATCQLFLLLFLRGRTKQPQLAVGCSPQVSWDLVWLRNYPLSLPSEGPGRKGLWLIPKWCGNTVSTFAQ